MTEDEKLEFAREAFRTVYLADFALKGVKYPHNLHYKNYAHRDAYADMILSGTIDKGVEVQSVLYAIHLMEEN